MIAAREAKIETKFSVKLSLHNNLSVGPLPRLQIKCSVAREAMIAAREAMIETFSVKFSLHKNLQLTSLAWRKSENSVWQNI